MRNTKELVTIALSLFLVSMMSFASAQNDTKKLIKGKWKLVKETDGGKEITPKHSKLMIEFDKKGSFTVTAAYEETHKGSYTISEDGKKLTLNDEVSKDIKELVIEKIDKEHLNVSDFDGVGTVIEMTPAKGKDVDLSHREHLIVNRWHCYKSDEESNIELLIEFHSDRTYVIIPRGYKIPVATGDWKVDSENGNQILMDKREDGEHLELDILEIHTHTITLKNSGEDGITNHFRDEKLYQEMIKESKK
jgi:hypothetical protein